ncbi:MAG: alginate lyase family protein [Dongiaceae bacterium]
MTRLARLAALCLTASIVGLLPVPATGTTLSEVHAHDDPTVVAGDLMTPEERRALDLSDYVVTDPDASYFDVVERRRMLMESTDPLLGAQVENLGLGASCRQILNYPVLAGRMKLPPFYQSPDEWRNAAEPFFTFEGSLSRLAGSYVATGDPYFADCIADVLRKWSDSEAFLGMTVKQDLPQAWFAAESALFAAGMAYSIARPYITHERPQDARLIEAWLRTASRKHISGQELDELSCCNNHFYRRALHATVNGIVTGDDALFQYGISAIISALSEMNEDGGFPREISRGTLAAHYQNYAMLYLITIMQLAERQGYDLFHMKINGRSIELAAQYAIQAILHPRALEENIDASQQLTFIQDDQYFTWMEIFLAHFRSEEIEAFVRQQRPTFNRSAGGYVSLYFYNPTEEILVPHAMYIEGEYVTRRKNCSQHPAWYEDRNTPWRMECERRMRLTYVDLDQDPE